MNLRPYFKFSLPVQPYYLLVGGVIAVEVVFGYFFLWPKITEIGNLRKQVAEKQGEVDRLKKSWNYLSTVDQNKLRSDLEIATAALPDDKKVSGVVSGVSKVASASGVALLSLNFSPGRVSTQAAVESEKVLISPEVSNRLNVKSLDANITITGSLSQAKIFLQKLASASQILGVESVDYILGAAGNNLSASDIGSLSVKIYYQPNGSQNINVNYENLAPLTPEEEAVLAKLSPLDIFSPPPE